MSSFIKCKPMSKNLLSKLTLALCFMLFAAGAYAQQGVQVVRADGAPLFVPLSQLSRISFSNDLSAMRLELGDGSVRQVALAGLESVSFAALSGKETNFREFNEGAASEIVVGDNCLTGTSSTEPVRSMSLYDATGRRVASVNGNGQSMQLRISTAGLPAGVYVVNIESASQRTTRKVVINRN